MRDYRGQKDIERLLRLSVNRWTERAKVTQKDCVHIPLKKCASAEHESRAVGGSSDGKQGDFVPLHPLNA